MNARSRSPSRTPAGSLPWSEEEEEPEPAAGRQLAMARQLATREDSSGGGAEETELVPWVPPSPEEQDPEVQVQEQDPQHPLPHGGIGVGPVRMQGPWLGPSGQRWMWIEQQPGGSAGPVTGWFEIVPGQGAGEPQRVQRPEGVPGGLIRSGYIYTMRYKGPGKGKDMALSDVTGHLMGKDVIKGKGKDMAPTHQKGKDVIKGKIKGKGMRDVGKGKAKDMGKIEGKGKDMAMGNGYAA
jgi:hypothetical protein